MSLVSHFEQGGRRVIAASQVKWKFHLSKQCKKMGFHICLHIQIHYPIFIKKKQEERTAELYLQNIGKVMEQSTCKASGYSAGQEVIRVL